MKRTLIYTLIFVMVVIPTCACGGSKAPIAGTTFTGNIDMGEQATSGTISFDIANDGTSIANIDITILDLNCKGLKMGKLHDNLGSLQITISADGFEGSIPVMGTSQFSESSNYEMTVSPFDFPSFEDMGNAGNLEGKFTSAKAVNGTIKLLVWAVMTDRACEFGTLSWEANAP
jgi:hypothetical protein